MNSRQDKFGWGRWLMTIFVIIGIVIAIRRFVSGIGAVSNLTDGYPWGLWIGFDVMAGVALAAGGFTTAAIVYIFGRKKYHCLARPAILTAFLGYILVIIGLSVDVGRPWNLWRPVFHWNPHSAMFEVGMCVLLYTIVLAIEFSPIFFERYKMQGLLKLSKKVAVGAVIAGVVLSTLHQSSLGSLYLLLPHKLHPLWHSPILPLLFLISAIAVGPAMVMLEGSMAARAFNRKPHTALMAGIVRYMPWLLGVYLIMKGADLVGRDAVAYAFTLNLQAIGFWLEIVIGVMLPIALLMQREIYENRRGQFWAGLCMVIGVAINRMNVAVTGILVEKWQGYYPSWGEFFVTIGIISAGLLIFRYVVKNFAIYEESSKPETPTPEAALERR